MDNFGDLTNKNHWNEIERSIMWIWWEYLDPFIGPLLGYNGDNCHSYLTWVAKGAITVFLLISAFFLPFFFIIFKTRLSNVPIKMVIDVYQAPNFQKAKKAFSLNFPDYTSYMHAQELGAPNYTFLELIERYNAPNFITLKKIQEGRFPDYKTYKDAQKINISTNEKYSLLKDTFDPFSPFICNVWLNKASIDLNIFTDHKDPINQSIKLLLKYLRDNQRFPTTRELFNMGAQLDSIKMAVQLFNSPVDIQIEDAKEINWPEWDKRSQKFVQILGESPEKYTIENLVIDSNEDIIMAKFTLALLPFLEKNEWISQISEEIRRIDEIAADLIRLQYRENWDKLNYLKVSFNLKIGVLTAIQAINYAQRLLEEEPSISDLKEEGRLFVEKNARRLSLAEQEGKIDSFSNPGQVAEVLDMKSIFWTIKTITFFTNEVLGQTVTLKVVTTDKTELKIQETLIVSSNDLLDQEIDKLMKQFEEMDKFKESKKI